MADLEEITESPRTGGGDDLIHGGEGHLSERNGTKRKRSRKRRNSAGSRAQDPEERREDDEGGKQTTQHQADGQKQDMPLAQEDLQAQFYRGYRKVADEYDEEFLKKHDEDLNTTLIFAGLFSAVASAFIIEGDSQLQPDPNEETAALLRVLLYKMDNTTFGNEVPAPPYWTGPPRATVHVQAILYASLTTSLFSAFLAMLGKQWLNRYDSTDLRGTAIERSQNRQLKLNGIVTWYFETVMGWLPLMLQAALLLFVCALSRHLWEINMTVASVVIGVTSFGVLSYLFIVIAGAASESCPYQTPGAHILRYHLLPALLSTSSKCFSFIKTSSLFYEVLTAWFEGFERPWYKPSNALYIIVNIPILPPVLCLVLVSDILRLGLGVLRLLVAFGKTVYHKSMAISHRAHGPGQQTTTLNLQCISWMLQTSLDKVYHLIALEYLAAIPKLPSSHPSLVVGCFDVFISCVNVINGTPVMMQGLEQLATLSASCFLRTLRRSFLTDPTSSTLADFRQRYNQVFSSGWADSRDLPFHYTMIGAYLLVNQQPHEGQGWWNSSELSTQEHIELAECVAGVAEVVYRQTWRRKVPRWTLRFVLDSLSLDPPPPPSVVANCLKIVAIDLGCDVPNVGTTGEREAISDLITQKLETMVGSRVDLTQKYKAINALLPHAISLKRSGDSRMADAISSIARASSPRKSLQHYIGPYMVALLSEPTSPSLDCTATLLSLSISWNHWDENTVSRWAAAVSTIPYSEDLGRVVVDSLLQLSSLDNLRSHIPIGIWAWLKRRPSLPPVCEGRTKGTQPDVVSYVERLGDPELLTSYFLLVWSEWNGVRDGPDNMVASIVRRLRGIRMQNHREELIQRLDHILRELDRQLRRPELYLLRHRRRSIQRREEQYRALREVLVVLGQ